ncbi:hypothetical protein CAG64_21655 [Vibrio sp. V38_P2S17PM301]|nr:hypothetical protein [Vibrio sp. V36_P2S2PM302]NAX28054.1 hypothetical protein [Vibrio sp. V38_P2S17PM301]NAX31085.1 hypothetical protein [Vibrio sp. V37_P2S8PM304]
MMNEINYFELAISFLTITAEAMMKAMIRPSSMSNTSVWTVILRASN